MLNTRDLERRWLRYKIKSFVPHAVITFSLAVISTVIYFYFSSSQKLEENFAIANQKTPQLQPQQETTLNNTQSNQVNISAVSNTDSEISSNEQHINTKKVVLKPSLDFMKNIQDSSNGYYERTPQEETFQTQYVASSTSNEAIDEVIVEQVEEEIQDNSKKIVIARETSTQDIQDAEKRFKKNNNPALSLFLSKQYYAKGDYPKSYNYALITNQLDKNNEDSWLVFARSLVKLGKKDSAEKALKEYIKFSHSSNAQLLLDDITTGKFQ